MDSPAPRPDGHFPGMDEIWLNAMPMKSFREHPLVAVRGEGIEVITDDGRRLLDGTSAAMVTNLGYSNSHVQEAVVEQVRRLPFWPVLHGTSDAALALTRKLNEVLPGDLGHVFLVSGGSEATETAMKMARQYQALAGRPRKTKIIGRYGSYHGATLGALSASGLRTKNLFAPTAPGMLHVLPPDAFRCPVGWDCDGGCQLGCLRILEQTIAAEGRDSIAAVIVDPVMAAAGIIAPAQPYYHRVKELCGEDILLIFDEVLTGFGRTGHWFAADYYGVVPDIICLGKGLSAGYAPLAAVAARPFLSEKFDRRGATFQHIHTFGGHPVAAAAGLAVIEQMQENDLVAQASRLGERLMTGLREIAARVPAVGDVRGLGLLAGLELVSDPATRTPFERPLAPAVVAHAADHEDLLIRSTRDVVQVAPPLVCTPEDIDHILRRLERALTAVTVDRVGLAGSEPSQSN